MTSTSNQLISKEKIVFIIAGLACLTPWVSPPLALLAGIIIAQFFDHPFQKYNQKVISILLQFSVVGLGFGMSLTAAIQSGKSGLLFTIASIAGTLFFGLLLGKLFKTEKKTSFLIAAGTAICGGSAIAALSPVIQSKEKQTSIALGTIFILNAAALFIFPVLGHYFNLSQSQFGLWCAIAIHDTSSVVGAANKFGAEALQVATTVKLMRALWIIPIALISAFVFKNPSKKIKIPYFIGLFVLAMLANTFFEPIQRMGGTIVALAKIALTLTLFFIGTSLSKTVIKSVGFKPLFQGIILWLLISGTALYAVFNFA